MASLSNNGVRDGSAVSSGHAHTRVRCAAEGRCKADPASGVTGGRASNVARSTKLLLESDSHLR